MHHQDTICVIHPFKYEPPFLSYVAQCLDLPAMFRLKLLNFYIYPAKLQLLLFLETRITFVQYIYIKYIFYVFVVFVSILP